jgi:hypothetical protein
MTDPRANNTSATDGFLELSPAPGLVDIEDVLSGIIAGITGLPGDLIRPRWQPEPPRTPKKAENWCAFGETGSIPDIYPQIRHYGEGEGHDELIDRDEFSVLVSFYGPQHVDLALLLRAGIYVPQNRASLRPAGMAFVKAGSITRLPEVGQSGIRARADLPLTFRRFVVRSIAVLNLKQSGGSLENDNNVIVPFGCDAQQAAGTRVAEGKPRYSG